VQVCGVAPSQRLLPSAQLPGAPADPPEPIVSLPTSIDASCHPAAPPVPASVLGLALASEPASFPGPPGVRLRLASAQADDEQPKTAINPKTRRVFISAFPAKAKRE